MGKSQSKKKEAVASTEATSFSFEVTDFRGGVVYLPPGRWEWKILEVHPDLRGYEEAVKSTALDPDIVFHEEDIQDMEIRATYDLGIGIYSKKYLWVPIKYIAEKGLVVTAYWLPDIKPGKYKKIEWRRK